MPLTEEQKKINNRIAVKKWNEANKEKRAIYDKEYRDTHQEQIKKRKKEYNRKEYLKDPEKFRLRNDKWKTENPDKVKAYLESDLYKKQAKISRWKRYGIICNDFEVIHRIYMDTTNCDFCQEPFTDSLDRHLDHDHSITDSFNIRGILCMQCNITDKLKGYDIMDLDGDL